MAERSGRSLKREEEGGRTIASLDELVDAVVQWFGYDRLEESPFPSGEPPPEAARKWFEEHLGLEVIGRDKFRWTCPSCRSPIHVETNYLHTLPMFDYEYWRYCPSCSAALDEED